MSSVVVDSDFFIKLTEYDANTKLFVKVLDNLKLKAVMHEYVAKTELKNSPYIDELINSGYIKVYDYNDYLKNDEERIEYNNFFIKAYESMTGLDWNEGDDIYKYSATGENLGEIRSLYLAWMMQVPYMASDDRGARTFADNMASKRNDKVEFINIEDAIRMCNEKGCPLSKNDIKIFVHNAYANNKKKIDAIYNLVN